SVGDRPVQTAPGRRVTGRCRTPSAEPAWRTSTWSDAAGHSFCVQAAAFLLPPSDPVTRQRNRGVRLISGDARATATETVPVTGKFPWTVQPGAPHRA